MSIKTRRFWASVIDWGIIALVSTFLMEFFEIIDLSFENSDKLRMYMISFMIIAYILFKDVIFKNASLGKLMFGIRVISNNGHCTPSVRMLILRNLSLVGLFPVDFVVVFLKNQRRLGDIWANTDVVIWK